jgi:transposase, IS5 family
MTNKKQQSRGLFDEYEQLEKLSKLKDPLEKLSRRIDFELFRPTLDLIYEKTDRKSLAGAKPFDYVLMFKIIILQRLYNLSDEQMEFQLTDRLSFRRFVGLEFSHKVPDCNTIWNFKEKLKVDNNEEKLFKCFYEELEKQQLIVATGKMVDASFHEVPRQRNTREENELLKKGAIPINWDEKKRRHKDTDATWTKKNSETFYGYKNHIKADVGSKLIDKYAVSEASLHDSQALKELLSDEDAGQKLFADSAYVGQEEAVEKAKMENFIHEKGYKNRPLTDEQKKNNQGKSRIRARVEHIFGFVETSMHGTYMRCIGVKRAKVVIGLTNLTYNICRAVQLKINMFEKKCVQKLELSSC